MTITALPLTSKLLTSCNKSTMFAEVSAKFGDGYGQSAPKGLNNKIDTWVIEWGGIGLTDKTTIETMLNSVGSWGLISWTPIDEIYSKKFRMDKSGYTAVKVGKTSFKISCKLIQVFDIG